MDNTKQIKTHFDDEAERFDGNIVRLIPFYPVMIEALTRAICLDHTAPLDAIDLGCGTGTVSFEVMKSYPNTRMTCMDLSANMLELARNKLKTYHSVKYDEGNFRTYRFAHEYDIVVSSLALHHLETWEHKLVSYKRIYNALKPGGVFANADIVIGTSDALQEMYLERWKNFMGKSVGHTEIEETWMRKYHDEDRPESLMRHLDMMKEAGFREIDVVWKYYNFAVWRGGK